MKPRNTKQHLRMICSSRWLVSSDFLMIMMVVLQARCAVLQINRYKAATYRSANCASCW